ncbi:MAG TPA: DUF1360 domain-containing protein [Pseudonocardiaceae bacterium]|jgi:hypothetical protein|nr:DUF1360 domain-containing protein [Pseudonocardiaceae bacterium]
MAKTLHGKAHQVEKAYAGDAERPLGGYLIVLGTYAGFTATLLGIGRLRGKRLPGKVGIGDAALLSVATHKLSRLVAKDALLSPMRAAFTRYEEPAGDGELNESVRGHGIRHAVGELISCPFCLAVWIATGLVGGLALAPRLTRTVELIMTAVAASDALQLLYDTAKDLPEG